MEVPSAGGQGKKTKTLPRMGSSPSKELRVHLQLGHRDKTDQPLDLQTSTLWIGQAWRTED